MNPENKKAERKDKNIKKKRSSLWGEEETDKTHTTLKGMSVGFLFRQCESNVIM